MKKKVLVHNYTPYQFKIKKPYGFGAFLLDAILTLLTGGVWLLFLLIQWMRGR